MLTIACRDVGQPCDCVLSGEMEEEHLKSAAEHAVIENIPQIGNLSFRGAATYITNSTGELSFLNGILGIFKGEGDPQSGDFMRTGWEWK